MASMFATAADYTAKYDTDMSDARLAVWLADASAIMAHAMDDAGVDYSSPDEDFGAVLRSVCRDMVHRAIGDGTAAAMSIPYGASQASMAAGGYSESFTMANPYGDLFLKQVEYDLLGVTSGGFSVAAPSFGNAEAGDD